MPKAWFMTPAFGHSYGKSRGKRTAGGLSHCFRKVAPRAATIIQPGVLYCSQFEFDEHFVEVLWGTLTTCTVIGFADDRVPFVAPALSRL